MNESMRSRPSRLAGSAGLAPFAALALLGAGLAATGCSREVRVESEPGRPGGTAAWTADIRAAEPDIALDGSATAVADPDGTRVTVRLRGASPGESHPWHVHEGRCGSDGPVVGSTGAYPLLEVDAGGNAEATANLAVLLSTRGDYYINIHASRTDPSRIVGCGELRRM